MVHLSRISTRKSKIIAARDQGSAEALEFLVLRYHRAAYAYFLKLVGDPDDAEDLRQEFTFRYLSGRYVKVDVGGGGRKYRNYLKAAIVNLARDHRRGRKRLPPEVPGGDAPDPGTGRPESERFFMDQWAENLKALAWESLEALERTSGRPLHTVLRFRVEHPDLRSQEIAERLATPLGKALSPERIRGLVHEAREWWKDALVAEVARSLSTPTREDVEAELIDLGWLDDCKAALGRLFPR